MGEHVRTIWGQSLQLNKLILCSCLFIIGCFDSQSTLLTWRFSGLKSAQKVEIQLVVPQAQMGWQSLSDLKWSEKPDSCKQVQKDQICWFSKNYPDSTFKISLEYIKANQTVSAPSTQAKTIANEWFKKAHLAMTYQDQKRDISLAQALAQKKGDCTQFTEFVKKSCEQNKGKAEHLRGFWKGQAHSFLSCQLPIASTGKSSELVYLDPTSLQIIDLKSQGDYFILSSQMNSFKNQGSAFFQVKRWGGKGSLKTQFSFKDSQ